MIWSALTTWLANSAHHAEEVVQGLVGTSSMGGVKEGIDLTDDQYFHWFRG